MSRGAAGHSADHAGQASSRTDTGFGGGGGGVFQVAGGVGGRGGALDLGLGMRMGMVARRKCRNQHGIVLSISRQVVLAVGSVSNGYGIAEVFRNCLA
jgi:hypothetical protein